MMKRIEAAWEWRNGFGCGFAAGMFFMSALMLVASTLSGCRMEGTFVSADSAAQADSMLAAKERLRAVPREWIESAQIISGRDTVYLDGYELRRLIRLDSLRVQSDRAVTGAERNLGIANIPESPDRSAAKVASVMAANDITLPQVAAYLNTYGLDVVQQSAWRRVHFAPAPDAYWYEHELRFADGDTAFEFQLRGVVDQARAFDRVRGVNTLPNGTVQYGPWSEVGHDAKAALPGIGEYAK